MTLRDQGRVLVDVGLNEFTTKAQNPHVPYGPEEVAQDAVECVRAGATSIHFHARTPDGAQAWGDTDYYRSTMELIVAELDAPLWYTTYNTAATERSPDGHAHDWALADDPVPRAPLEMIAFDVPQGVRPASLLWNEEQLAFEPVGFDTVGTTDSAIQVQPPELAEAARRGLVPVVGIFDTGDARWAVLAMRAGVLSRPAVLKLVLCGQMVLGPFPSPEGLDAYLAQLAGGVDVECIVEPYLMTEPDDCDMVLAAALDRGLGVRVGIGDSPAAYPHARNAELVARAVDMARARGLEPATPSEGRAALRAS